MSIRLQQGDCRKLLADLPGESVQCVVTSPPYYNLRDYGVPGQIGREPTHEDYVDVLVQVFRQVRQVLRADGTLWLNLGDSYCRDGGIPVQGRSGLMARRSVSGARTVMGKSRPTQGLKPKDLMLVPARVAIALQEDGWWVRSEIVWSKAAPMPESVRDRPTCAHEKVWLLTKASTYFYDADAVREPYRPDSVERVARGRSNRHKWADGGPGKQTLAANISQACSSPLGANLRNVWHLNPESFPGAHFATMPATLAERCIKAGSRPGDTVLDPFAGAGTTLLVADRLQRHAIGIELNPAYCELIERRLGEDAPLLAEVA